MRLGITGAGAASRELAADHVIAATGYRIDLNRLAFLPDAIRSRLRTVAGSAGGGARLPVFRVPGSTSSGRRWRPTMGPVMRFVFGSGHAATAVGSPVGGYVRPEGRGRQSLRAGNGQRQSLGSSADRRGEAMTALGRNGSAGARASVDRLGLGRVPMILMYHGVADVAEDPNHLCVTPSRFAEQMTWLQRPGLRGVGIGTLVDAIACGPPARARRHHLRRRVRQRLEAALPELLRHGFTASMFIISDRLGGHNEWDEGPRWPLMSASQVGELAAAGMEIGSHGATHERLAGLGADQLEAEVSGSRASLGELVGDPIRGFAYPYGSMDAAARQAVRDAGYDYACAVQTPIAELGFMALPRIYVGQRDGARRMAAKRLLFRGYIAVKGRRP